MSQKLMSHELMSQKLMVLGYADPTQTGKVDIELKFAQELPETVSVIVYCQYSSKIIINKGRKVTTDF